MIPAGADAVVRVEDTRREGGRVLIAGRGRARPRHPPRRRGHRAGRDGARARAPRLGPAELGVARLGRRSTRVACHRRPRVCGADHRRRAARARARRCAPAASATPTPTRSRRWPSWAGAEAVVAGSAPDDPRRPARRSRRRSTPTWSVALRRRLGRRARPRQAGARRARRRGGLLGRRAEARASRPGSARAASTLVFGLPGNPVSAMVTFVLLVAPGAARAERRAAASAAHHRAALAGDYDEAARPRPRRPLPPRAARATAGTRRPAGAPGLARPHLDARRRLPRDHPRRERRACAAGERVEVELLGRASMGAMTVRVRLFAVLRERAGSESVEVELRRGRDRRRRARARSPSARRWREAARRGCRCGWPSTASYATPGDPAVAPATSWP